MKAGVSAEAVVQCANILGESVIWSTRHHALYWVDIRAPALHRFAPGSGRHDSWKMPDLCPAVVLTHDGVALASRRSLLRFDFGSGMPAHILDIEPHSLGNRLNEAKVDRGGRLWIGSMRDFGAAVTGSLYSVSRTLQVRRILGDIRIPNSLGWSPDNRTMYFADTGNGALCAYSYDMETGAIRNMRILVEDGVLPGRPDGCAVDSEGFIWSARYGGGCVARISPAGRIVATIGIPASQPTSCALGGSDLRTLYVTTARQRLSDTQLVEQPQAGQIFAARVDVPGLPEMEFDFAKPS